MLNWTKYTGHSVLVSFQRTVGGGSRKRWHLAPNIPRFLLELDYDKLWWQSSDKRWCDLFYCRTCTQSSYVLLPISKTDSQSLMVENERLMFKKVFKQFACSLNLIFSSWLLWNHWVITKGFCWWHLSINLPYWSISLRSKNFYAVWVSDRYHSLLSPWDLRFHYSQVALNPATPVTTILVHLLKRSNTLPATKSYGSPKWASSKRGRQHCQPGNKGESHSLWFPTWDPICVFIFF